MSQTGKVLHLYVEVRSPPEHAGNGSSVEQDGPVEALNKLAQAASEFTAPARPNVSFQIQPTHDSPQRISIPQQEPFQQTSTGSDSKPSKHVHSLSYSGPGTPCRACRHQQNSKPEVGQRSVVTFRYIEKPHIKTVESPCKSPSGMKEEGSCLRKRCSDPVWSRPAESSSPFYQHVGSPGFHNSTLNPVGQASTQRALEEFGSPQMRCKFAQGSNLCPESHQQQRARCQSWEGSSVSNCSTYRHDPGSGRVAAMPKSSGSDGFSPHTGHNNQQKSTSRPHQKRSSKQDSSSTPVSQSWGTSANKPLSEQRTGLTNTPTDGLNQLSGSNNSSALNSPEVARRIAEEATKVSTIFNEVRSSPPPGVFGGSHLNSTNCEYPSREIQHESLQQCPVQMVVKMNIPVNEPQPPDCPPTNGVPTKNSGLVEELANRISDSVPMDGAPDSPALPSCLLRSSLSKADLCSPLRDPRLLRPDLLVTDSPTPHRHKTPQYTGEEWAPVDPWFLEEDDWCDDVIAESVEISRRLFIGQNVNDSPVSWTSRQQWKEQAKTEVGKFSLVEPLEGTLKSEPVVVEDRGGKHDSVSGKNQSLGDNVEEMTRITQQQRQAEWRRRQALLLGPVVLEDGDGESGEHQGLAGSSPSSSGVTGSLGDRDCISPESSQNSNQSEHPSSGIQVRRVRAWGFNFETRPGI